jgi:uncharacterized ferritin-like protein (DUF455 family)
VISIGEAVCAVLDAAEPGEKVKAARQVARAWRQGRLDHRFDHVLPDAPRRSERPELLPPNQMPRRGKGGSERGRIALLHALAHIEFVAIDLAFDMAARFGTLFPRDFVDDWVSVGADEAMHFAILDRRLRALGSSYGALPAHDGLWDAARATADDALARLAVVPMALEARGLDVTPATVERFRAAGDHASAAILHRIYTNEIRHVRFGTKWFEIACRERGRAPAAHWQELIGTRFRGVVKGPDCGPPHPDAGLLRRYCLSGEERAS